MPFKAKIIIIIHNRDIPFFQNLSLAVLGLHWCMGFSLVVASGGYSLAAVCGLLIVVVSHCRAWGLGRMVFAICSMWAQ